MFELISTVPFPTQFFAALALLFMFSTSLWSCWKAWKWARTARQLREVRKNLAESGLEEKDHHHLYQNFNHVWARVLEASQSQPSARECLQDDLGPSVEQYHRASLIGGHGGWEELSSTFLDKHYRTVKIGRSVASWVVLLGLAGTVLGFLEAVPELKEQLQRNSQSESEMVSPPAEDQQVEDSEVAAATSLARVFGSLGGVFLATFCGVISAFWLHLLSAGFVEPAFSTFAREVGLFGRRWCLPLLHRPDTLLHDALRDELKEYFRLVSKEVSDEVRPLIQSLATSLNKMDMLSSSFVQNIESGQKTIKTFHDAVHGLGEAAAGAVGQVVAIVKTSQDFLDEVKKLQTEGGQQLEKIAAQVAQPVQAVSESVRAIEQRLGSLDQRLSTLGSQQSRLAELFTESTETSLATREVLQRLSESSSLQTTELTAIRHGMTSLAPQAAATLTQSAAAQAEKIREVLSGLPDQVRAGLAERPGDETFQTVLSQMVQELRSLNSNLQRGKDREQIQLLHEIRSIVQKAGSRKRTREFAPPRKRSLKERWMEGARDLVRWEKSPILRGLGLVKTKK